MKRLADPNGQPNNLASLPEASHIHDRLAQTSHTRSRTFPFLTTRKSTPKRTRPPHLRGVLNANNLSCDIAASRFMDGDSLPHLSEIIQRYFTPISRDCRLAIPIHPKSGWHAPESMDDILRIQWMTCIGIGGRHQSESLVDMNRNTHPGCCRFTRSAARYSFRELEGGAGMVKIEKFLRQPVRILLKRTSSAL
jgi:hypothetical protein